MEQANIRSVVARTLSDVYRDRTPRESSRHQEPVLRVLLHAWRPQQPTSRHRLDEVDVVEFGRGPPAVTRDCDGGGSVLRIRVPDPMMSSEHGRLRRHDDHWLLDDPRSKNGATVAGQQTRCAPVRDGDLFELGHTLFLLDREPPDAALGDDLFSDTLEGLDSDLVTFSPLLRDDLATLARVATSDVPVLVLGESGTGKEVCAQALHRMSGRRGPMVAVHCGGLAPELLEAELFGHRKGAFSGAQLDRLGYVRSADNGTLFLDEIGDLPAAGQTAFLRVLQEREVVPVGDSRPVRIDVRVCAATHRDLPAMVAAGTFRQDLYARLLGVTVTLPPLRERRGDLGLLIARLLQRTPGGTDAHFIPAAAYALLTHDWPLNVRELERTLRAAVARAAGEPIDLRHLPTSLAKPTESMSAAATAPAPVTGSDPALRASLIAGLERHRGNVAAVARDLGQHREQVHRWLRRLGVDPAAFRR